MGQTFSVSSTRKHSVPSNRAAIQEISMGHQMAYKINGTKTFICFIGASYFMLNNILSIFGLFNTTGT